MRNSNIQYYAHLFVVCEHTSRGPVATGFRIMSDENPTTLRGTFYGKMYTATGASYQEAHDAVVHYAKTYLPEASAKLLEDCCSREEYESSYNNLRRLKSFAGKVHAYKNRMYTRQCNVCKNTLVFPEDAVEDGLVECSVCGFQCPGPTT